MCNKDQGSQFTNATFTGVLSKMKFPSAWTARGAWRDNVFVDRLWRSVEFLRAYDTASEGGSIGRCLEFYNPESQHPSVNVVEENRFC